MPNSTDSKLSKELSEEDLEKVNGGEGDSKTANVTLGNLPNSFREKFPFHNWDLSLTSNWRNCIPLDIFCDCTITIAFGDTVTTT